MSEYLPPLTIEEAEVAIDVMAENKRLRARLAAVEAERDEAQERSVDWHIKADGFRRERDRLWAERDEARGALREEIRQRLAGSFAYAEHGEGAVQAEMDAALARSEPA